MKKRFFGVLAAACVCVFLQGVIHTQQLQQDMAGKVLRFHVLANSDEEGDQQLKLSVRDAVGTMMAEKLKNVDSLEESRAVVTQNLNEIRDTAQETVRRQGYDYPVTAAMETCRFPEKTYGKFTFPAGSYEALRVVIGSGGGHNWWCVMYPNMCFSGSMYEVDASSGEILRKTLDPQEYQAVLEEGNYEIKFKILGFLNNLLE